MRSSRFGARHLARCGVAALVAGAVLLGTGVAVSARTTPSSASVQAAKKTKPPSIKISPKSVANTGGTVTVSGKGWTADPTLSILVCAVDAASENNCDLSTVQTVNQVNSNGTFSQSFPVPGGSNNADGYADEAGDVCGTSKTTQKSCGIAVGNESESETAGPVAITIKAPKVKK